jgi:hypothetical protein
LKGFSITQFWKVLNWDCPSSSVYCAWRDLNWKRQSYRKEAQRHGAVLRAASVYDEAIELLHRHCVARSRLGRCSTDLAIRAPQPSYSQRKGNEKS